METMSVPTERGKGKGRSRIVFRGACDVLRFIFDVVVDEINFKVGTKELTYQP